MENSLRLSYNIIMFFALVLSVFIHLPIFSLQMIFLILIAFTASVFLIPLYILAGLVFPVFMQGGGVEYIHESYFLILVLFSVNALLFRPLLGIRTTRPWVWYPFLILLYLGAVYVPFFLLAFLSSALYGSYMGTGMDTYAFIIMLFSSIIAASILVVAVNRIRTAFESNYKSK